MSFDETVLSFAAPALCGIKPANLFSVPKSCLLREQNKISSWTKDFMAMGREIQVIERSKNLFLFFAFDRKLLCKTLSGSPQMKYLKSKGYPVGSGWNTILLELFFRLSNDEAIFPHEIGLFLGYPLSDVVAFEKDGGKKSKYTGFWQVYSNVDEACKKMKLYRECSTQCCKQLAKGTAVPVICKAYSNREKKL